MDIYVLQATYVDEEERTQRIIGAYSTIDNAVKAQSDFLRQNEEDKIKPEPYKNKLAQELTCEEYKQYNEWYWLTQNAERLNGTAILTMKLDELFINT